MPGVLPISDFMLPPPHVIPAESLEDERGPRSRQLRRLALLFQSIAGGRADLRDQSERFDEFFTEAERSELTPEDLEQGARIILQNEQNIAATLVPQMEQIKQKLARKHVPTPFARSARRAAEDALEVAETWLELYQNLRLRLLKLASDRRVAAGEAGSPVFADGGEMEQYLRRLVRG